MIRKIFLYLILILMIAFAVNASYSTVYNPFTGKIDYVQSDNQSGQNWTIGILNVTDTSEFNGVSTFNDNVEINGNLTVIGDVVVMNVSQLDVNGSIYPSVDDTFDLGTNLLTWDNAYVNTMIFGNSSAAILDSPTQSYLRVGDAGTTTHTFNTNDDLFVSGRLEVDGNLFLDNPAYAYSNFQTIDGALLYFGTSADALITYSATHTPDTLVMGLSADSNGFIITEKSDYNTDFGQPLKDNPTLFIQSSNASDTDEFISFEHDQTDARVVSGQGDLRLTGQETVNVDTNFTMGDTDNYLLYEEYSNGTHYVMQSYQDLDLYFDPSGNVIRLPTDANVTWDNGAKISVNSTCISLFSPAGSGVYSVCD